MGFGVWDMAAFQRIEPRIMLAFFIRNPLLTLAAALGFALAGLWSWRHEWGTTREWRRRLGEAAFDAGADDLFAHITRV